MAFLLNAVSEAKNLYFTPKRDDQHPRRFPIKFILTGDWGWGASREGGTKLRVINRKR